MRTLIVFIGITLSLILLVVWYRGRFRLWTPSPYAPANSKLLRPKGPLPRRRDHPVPVPRWQGRSHNATDDAPPECKPRSGTSEGKEEEDDETGISASPI